MGRNTQLEMPTIDVGVAGPMARSTRDLALVVDIAAGPGEFDDAAWQLNLPRCEKHEPREFRVAVKLTDPLSPVAAEYQAAIQRLASELAAAGAHVREVEPGIDTARSHVLFTLLARAGSAAYLSEEELAHVVRLGERAPEDSYRRRSALGSNLSHREWLLLHSERVLLRRRWQAFFQDWDVLLCPVGPTAAWPHDQVGERPERFISVDGKPLPSTSQMFWAGYSGIAYLPSAVAPIGHTATGLPLGVQVIAPYLHDRTALQFCELLERHVGGFTPPPGY